MSETSADLRRWRVLQRHTVSPLSPFVPFEFKNRPSLCQLRHFCQQPESWPL